MVYKKVIVSGGKKYGPYLYENKRVGDKIVTRYVGKYEANKKNNKFNNLSYLFLFVLVFLSAVFMYFYSYPTSNVVLELDESYKDGDIISGKLNFIVKEGELIPAESRIIAELNNESKEFLLSDLVDSNKIDGEFYVSNTNLIGYGVGYGLTGKKETYPTIDFELLISGGNLDSSGGGNTDEGANNQSNIIIGKEIGLGNLDENSSLDSGNDIDNNLGKSETEQIGDNLQNNDEVVVPAESSDAYSANNVDSSGIIDNVGIGESVAPEEELTAGITGAVVSDNTEIDKESNSRKINGKVGRDKEFIYELQEGESADIVSGSVMFNGGLVDDSKISIAIEGNKAIVKTDYSVVEEGYGSDYLGEEEEKIEVDLSKLGILAQEGELKIKLLYDGGEIANIKKNIKIKDKENEDNIVNESGGIEINDTIEVNESQIDKNESEIITNETFISNNLSLIKKIGLIRVPLNGSSEIGLKEYFSGAEKYEFMADNDNISWNIDNDLLVIKADEGFRGAIRANITAYLGNESLSEEFNIIVSGKIDIRTSRSQIKLGEKVKWIANVSLEEPENVTIELPKEASEIVVKSIDEGSEKEISTEIIGVTGNVAGGGNIKNGLFRFFDNLFGKITGRVTADVELNNSNLDLERDNASLEIGDKTYVEAENDESIQIILSDNSSDYVIEYYTDAPYAVEEEKSYGKKVTIYGPEGLNYTDVLSFTNISEVYSLEQKERIKIFWVENESYINFDAYDLDGNDMIDYVEWITPHLSNQTFEIILITKAEHLDENRTFIEDVYDYVKEQDNNWTTIPEGHYIRVKFEKNLTSEKDITIYARISCAENSTIRINGIAVPCEIYKKKLRLDGMRVER